MYGTYGWVQLPVGSTYKEYSMWDMRWSHKYNKVKNRVKEVESINEELEGA